MFSRLYIFIVLFLGPLGLGKLEAHPRLSPLFSDHAVLQRGKDVPIWGSAEPGEKITVRYQNQEVRTITDLSGKWSVSLVDPKPGEAGRLEVMGDGTIMADDVVVGDVWLIAGQSNMEWPLSKATGGEAEAAAADMPWLRHMKIRHRVSAQPESDFDANWIVASPQSAGDFSAVGYYFAKHLYGDGRVPVGLLNVSYGGTKIESWMGANALARAARGVEINKQWKAILMNYPARNALFEQEMATWRSAKENTEKTGGKYTVKPPARPQGPGHVTQPSGLYNGMLSPLMPAAIKGVIWYQGESNVNNSADEYSDMLSALAHEWRAGFGNVELPFFIVQLPNYADPKFSWAGIRSAQAKVASTLPAAQLVVTIDIGAARDKHPRNKNEVGRRIALLARKQLWGESIVANGPEVKCITRSGNQLKVEFTTDGQGLVLKHSRDGAASVEIAGADKVYKAATVVLDESSLLLECLAVPDPVHVRYLYHGDSVACLFNEAGLPVAPFENGLIAVNL